MTPADAKKTFGRTLMTPGVLAAKLFINDDLRSLRSAYVDDLAFTDALLAISSAILEARSRPTTTGTPLEHRLGNWRRLKFASRPGGLADLRLIFQPAPDEQGINILAFGNRFMPQSVYKSATDRL